jgi:hypothetical protein
MDFFFTNNNAAGFLFTCLVVVGVCGPLVAHAWLKHRRAELEIELKRELVERGMSAAEICAVIEASAYSRSEACEDAATVSHSRARA